MKEKRLIKKLCMVALICLGIATSAQGQDFLPFVNDNYAGITGVYLNPASIANSRYRVDVTLFGASVNRYNNFLSVDRKYLRNYYLNPNGSFEAIDGTTTTWKDVDARKEGFLKERLNGVDKWLNEGVQLQALNFMVSINPKWAVGFTARGRQNVSINNVSEVFAHSAFNDMKVYDYWYGNSGDRYYNTNMSINIHRWAEYGLTGAGVLWQNDEHMIKGGVTLKLLQGLGALYINSKMTGIEIYDDQNVGFYNEEGTGTSFGYGTSGDMSKLSLNTASKSMGFGFDLGFIYEWRPNYREYLYDMDGQTDLERKDLNKYKLRIGVSLTDVGSLKYVKGNGSQDFNLNGSQNISSISDNFNIFTNAFIKIDQIDQFTEGVNQIADSTFGDSEYRMRLPMSLSMQFDYNIWDHFYVNLTPYFALRQINNTNIKTHGYTIVSLTPRYERKWWGVSLPLQYNQLVSYKFAVGLGLRLGPVWVGTGDIVNTFIKKNTMGSDFHCALKVPILYGPPQDRDGDKVSDKKDECIDEPGPWERMGCPLQDRDGDGIVDDEDECPDVPGVPEFNGCPDTDGDGIPDHLDDCPDVFGLAEYKGCPDTDGDGIPDNMDDCPDVFGLAEFKGCPDSDGDGIPDNLDDCPLEQGPKENNGCPVVIPVDFAYLIQFEVYKSDIKAESFEHLDKLVQIMNDNPDYNVKVDGYTDVSGGDHINIPLSQKRADAVKDYLVKKGISADRIEAKGHGSANPIAPNDTPENRNLNRRTEINLIQTR
ncbi:MAG: DUF5723 family protein [Bacteroidales bacterium]|nr:DUF5723 family protein [Bacteroidales bacterium]